MGATVAIAAWLGWLELSPFLGFPHTAAAGMFERVLAPMGGMGWLGWAALLLVEAALAALYLAALRSGWIPGGIHSGLLYGVALWIIAGAVVMPVMAMGAPAMSGDSMGTSFMMLHLGLLAPINALIGRLLYGALLGATVTSR